MDAYAHATTGAAPIVGSLFFQPHPQLGEIIMKHGFRLSMVSAALLLGAGSVHADAVIYNTGNPATAMVALGIKDSGALNALPNITANAGRTGLAAKFPDGLWYDATSPGCLCEGWGVSATLGSTPYTGYDGTDKGFANLTSGPMTGVTPSTATTTAWLTNLPGLEVKHAYSPADNAPGALFKSVVTITNNTGSPLADVRYVRVMDWDVPPTEFSEHVTIQGVPTMTLLERSHDNGFEVPDPLASTSERMSGTTDVDFTDFGPADHGAYFKFNFGGIADGASYTFKIFYGAAPNEADALAAIAAESIELYSLGQSSIPDGDPTTGTPMTYIFGFSGVGGQPPVGVPEPASLALLGLGLASLAAMRRRKQAV